MSYFAGIDWAMDKHDICILDEAGAICVELIISDDSAGYQQLDRVLRQYKDIRIVLEKPDGLLLEYLIQKGWKLFFIPPIVSAKRRPRRSKTDTGDAYLLANLLRQNDSECRPIRKHSQQVQTLRQIVKAYDTLQVAQKRHSAQLHHLLHRYYPVVLRLFSKLHQPLTYAFLEAFSGPEAARSASLDELREFFRNRHYPCMDRIPHFYQLIQSETVSAHLLEGYVVHTQALIGILRSLYEQLKHLKKQLHQAFRQHPDAQWLLQFPGLGELNGARILARMGDNRASIETDIVS